MKPLYQCHRGPHIYIYILYCPIYTTADAAAAASVGYPTLVRTIFTLFEIKNPDAETRCVPPLHFECFTLRDLLFPRV